VKPPRFYTLVIGDSREMKEVPDRSVNLIVTSPPYWNLLEFSTKQTDVLQGDLSRITDKKVFFKELIKVWRECSRVLDTGGYLVCEWEDIPCGVYSYPREVCIAGDMIKSIEDAGLYLVSRWFWKKFAAGAVLRKFQYTLYSNLPTSDPRACANVAYVFVFRKYGGRGEFKREKKLDFTKEQWTEWVDSLWYIENPADEHFSAVFALDLVKRLIRIYTEIGDVVLDPFLGSGTTMKAAVETRRSCIGYEVRKTCEHCNKSMVDVIKEKVGWGVQGLDEQISWKVIEK